MSNDPRPRRTAYKSCKDCADRHPGCHSECETYKSFRAKCDAAIAERKRTYQRNLITNHDEQVIRKTLYKKLKHIPKGR